MKRMLFLFCLTSPLYGADFSAWLNKSQLTFNGYTNSTILTNFPALVVIGTNIGGFAWSQFNDSKGFELRFGDTANNELNYEFDSGTNTVWTNNGLGLVWVRLPVLSVSTSIWTYWGNAAQAATRPAYTTNGSVWSEGYNGVWHFGTSGNINTNDSTTNANTLVNSGVISSNNSVFGSASAHFNGSARLLQTTSPSLILTSNKTISVWLRFDASTEVYNSIFEKSTPAAYVYFFGFRSDRKIAYYEFNNNSPQRFIDFGAGAALTLGQWTHVSVSWDSSKMIYWMNGKSNAWVAAAAAAAHTPADSQFTIGWSRYGSGRWLKGGLDEARVCRSVRSADWLFAEYLNMASNSTFQSLAQVQASQGQAIPFNRSLVKARNELRVR